MFLGVPTVFFISVIHPEIPIALTCFAGIQNPQKSAKKAEMFLCLYKNKDRNNITD
jgi:hypothetical protein